MPKFYQNYLAISNNADVTEGLQFDYEQIGKTNLFFLTLW
jgi:hypothetical protein